MALPDDIWLVDFGDPHPGEPAYLRPAVVIGPPAMFGPGFPFVIVCPMTTVDRGLSLHVELEPTEATGLDVTSFVQCELVRSVHRHRLVHKIGVAGRRDSEHIAVVLQTLLGLP